jgi:S-DNA-T family DNA segregation ATPase FtsK/SpoIIIE
VILAFQICRKIDMNEIPRKVLHDILQQYGEDIINDGRRCEALLMDLCPTYRKEIRVLLAALNEKIPYALLNESSKFSTKGLFTKLEKKLVDNQAITVEASKWAVSSWAVALEIIPDSGNDDRAKSSLAAPAKQKLQRTPNKKSKDPVPLVPQSKNPNSQTSYRIANIISLGVLALALIILLNQLFYVIGASFSTNILYKFFGQAAYFIPFLLALAAWRIIQRAKRPSFSFGRVLAFVLFLISISGLIDIFGGYSGTVGKSIGENLIWLIGRIGGGVLLSSVTIASLLVITNLSFAFLSENLEIAFSNFRIHFDEWQAKRREAKRVQSKELSEKKTPKAEVKPTISTGETSAAGKKEKAGKSTGKVSEMVMEFAAAPAVENEIVPTLPSSAEKPLERMGTKTETPRDGYAELNEEVAPIGITPIRETGELAADLIEEEQSVEPEPVEADRPQNFDDYVLPTTEFLTPAPPHLEQKEDELLRTAQQLTEKTKEFNVTGRVMHICQGPVVTTYEFKPDPGVKYSRVTDLADDLCLPLKAESIRIERIPGKAFVGIEVPNQKRETIHLREVIESKKFTESGSLLTIALGKKIDGFNYVADLAKMPHLLIAGATGSGKSTFLHALIVSILYKAKPDEVKFILVDQNRLELGLYQDIPHLATPIITDPKRAAIALKWAVSEMEKRYKDLAGWGVRNIDGFNEEVRRRHAEGELDEDGNPFRTLPYIVIIIDDITNFIPSDQEIDQILTHIAQLGRAVGIHLVLSAQRPSGDVVTNSIKANFPSRISFRVSSKVDSRTIIDANGAERLLGRGDMLFLPPASSQVVRVHGAFVDEKEIARIVEHIKAQGKPEYDTTNTKTEDEMDDGGELPGRKDELFWDAVRTVVTAKKASTSLLQRHLRIGYGRAAAILDAMVREGYIGDMDGSSRARPILQKAYEDLQDIEKQENVK